MGHLPSLWTTTQALGGVAVIGVVSAVALLYKFQRSLVYPSAFPAGSRTEVLTPDHFDLPYEDVTLTTPDGERLKAFFLPQRAISEKERQRGESASEDEVTRRRPTVLFLHANAGNMGHRLPIASVFHRRFGCNVFMLSYRGYGFSTGQPSEQGLRIDSQTALDWIKRHDLLKETKVILYGQSIGGAVSVALAAKNPKGIDALILENTFLSVHKLIPHLLPFFAPFRWACTEYWRSDEAIQTIRHDMPSLFLSGRRDELVPPHHMDRLFELCSSRKKVWTGFDDGNHNDTCVKPGYFEAIASFLTEFIVPQLLPTETVSTSSDAVGATAPPLAGVWDGARAMGGSAAGGARGGDAGGTTAMGTAVAPQSVGAAWAQHAMDAQQQQQHQASWHHASAPPAPAAGPPPPSTSATSSSGARLRRTASTSSASSSGSNHRRREREYRVHHGLGVGTSGGGPPAAAARRSPSRSWLTGVVGSGAATPTLTTTTAGSAGSLGEAQEGEWVEVEAEHDAAAAAAARGGAIRPTPTTTTIKGIGPYAASAGGGEGDWGGPRRRSRQESAGSSSGGSVRWEDGGVSARHHGAAAAASGVAGAGAGAGGAAAATVKEEL